jgi:hypothetical protein
LAIDVSFATALVVSIYLFFAYHSKKKSLKYLNIQKVFHDDYTAINFMKALITNYDFIKQLDIDQINYLNKYLVIIRGGIAY